MNGEIEQMSSIVISARKALYEDREIEFSPSSFILSIKFCFAKRLILWKSEEANSVQKWFNICKKFGLDDIKFVIPTGTNRRDLLGFSNMSQGLIVCFWKRDKVSCFLPVWEFDSKQNGWNIVYKEQMGINIQRNMITFASQTDEFQHVLTDIEKLSTEIDFPYFSKVFRKACDALCDNTFAEQHHIPTQVPNEFKGIYYAVVTADVFGAMGSWNDSPPWVAHKMGLEKEYHELSDRLLHQIRHHLMYVVNECWQRN